MPSFSIVLNSRVHYISPEISVKVLSLYNELLNLELHEFKNDGMAPLKHPSTLVSLIFILNFIYIVS